MSDQPLRRLVFVCWPDPIKSEWVAVALGVAVAQVGASPGISVRQALPALSRSPMATGSHGYSGGGFPKRDVGGTRPLCIGSDVDDAAVYYVDAREPRADLDRETMMKIEQSVSSSIFNVTPPLASGPVHPVLRT